MKKILSIVLLVLCMALISGCMRFNTTIDIKSNGKADLSMLYAVQKTEGEDSGSSEDYDSQKKEMEKAGWSVEDYNEDGYVGLKCTMKNVDIKDVAEEVGTSNASVGNEESPIKLTKDGLVYNFDWDYNSGSNDDSSSDDSSGENSADEMQQYADAISQAPRMTTQRLVDEYEKFFDSL